MVILTSFPPPEEGVRYKQDSTQAFIRDKNMGTGALFIAESRLSWMGDNGQGFSLEYPAISLHAISRDTSRFPHECLYMMVEANLDENERQINNESESSGDEEVSENSNITEVRFVPADKTNITQMYEAMSDCQALHPDENDSFSDDEEGDDFYGECDVPASGDIASILTAEGAAQLAHMEEMLAQRDEPVVGRTEQTNGHGDMETEASTEGQFDDADMGDR